PTVGHPGGPHYTRAHGEATPPARGCAARCGRGGPDGTGAGSCRRGGAERAVLRAAHRRRRHRPRPRSGGEPARGPRPDLRGGRPAPRDLATRDPGPSCGALPAGSGQPLVVRWSGRPPATAGPGMTEGGDPVTGLPAAIGGFVFPLALAPGGAARYADDFEDV